MTLLQALILGIIQGITEFLPISSSGHLVLFESFMDLNVDQLKGFDVAVHFGSLIAILVYFWKDIVDILKGNYRLGAYVVVATIPAAVVGFTLEKQIDTVFRDPKTVLIMLFILAIFFIVAERFPRQKNRTRLTWANTFIMGCAQAVALIPGISRSGSIIGTGLLNGLKRDESARFAFLLGIPAIGGATLLTGINVYQGEAPLPAWDTVAVGFFSSALMGYLTVSFFMKFLKTHSLHVFTVYLILAAVSGWLFLV